ncbi:hypothetical protein KJ365_03765 [Glaciecola sp. XM2]|jgi:hypothetical protein|uniref:hypothetical protein n=1 Tax=Glaciecola sp. XM2 TaxID=1914931 RepID=UPI001BDEE234|nr:hypothetical protein [Glaciecola sp. XM2]MBT1449987.1 hypothetical protein [Glaciecola sp. XM2]
MIGYIPLGVRDVSESGDFYEDLSCMLGAKRVFEKASCLASLPTGAKSLSPEINTILL